MILLELGLPVEWSDALAVGSGVAGVLASLWSVSRASRFSRVETQEAQELVAKAVETTQTEVSRMLEHASSQREEPEDAPPDPPKSWAEQIVGDSLRDQATQTRELQWRVVRRYQESKTLSMLALVVGCVGISILIAAAILVVAGSVPLASAAGIGGLLASASSALVFRQADAARKSAERDDDKIHRQLEGQRRLALGVMLLREVREGDKRDEALVALVLNYQNQD